MVKAKANSSNRLENYVLKLGQSNFHTYEKNLINLNCLEKYFIKLFQIEGAKSYKKYPTNVGYFYNSKHYAFSPTISYGNSTITSLCNLTLAVYLPTRFTTPLVMNFLN